MRVRRIDPYNANSRLSIAHAMRQGYGITLESDGCAEVVKLDGTVYHVADWQCSCPDARCRDGGTFTHPDGRHFCKHVSWLAQLYPCPRCRGIMVLNPISEWPHFLCQRCCTLKAFIAVQKERRALRAQAEAMQREIEEMVRKGAEADRAPVAQGS